MFMLRPLIGFTMSKSNHNGSPDDDKSSKESGTEEHELALNVEKLRDDLSGIEDDVKKIEALIKRY